MAHMIDRKEVLKIVRQYEENGATIEDIKDTIRHIYEIPYVEFESISDMFRQGYQYAKQRVKW